MIFTIQTSIKCRKVLLLLESTAKSKLIALCAILFPIDCISSPIRDDKTNIHLKIQEHQVSAFE